MNDSVMFVVSGVDIGAGGEQGLHERHVPVHDGEVERREAVGVARVRQRRRRHQHAVSAVGARGLARTRAARRAVVQGAAQAPVTHPY